MSISAAMERYQYQPLPSGRYIRCATVQPGAPKDNIVLSLSALPFEEGKPPAYEALSYVWGSEGLKLPVYVDTSACGKGERRVLMVTQNLEVALRHLRYEDRPRTMWIDAICNNQDDKVEKGPQVALMGDLYRLASRVVVFLGAEADDSARAMHLLRSVGSQVDVDWKTHGISPRPGCADESVADQGAPLSLSDKDSAALFQILRRPWFERLWIRQEIHLAKRDTAMLVCGRETAGWVDFRGALFILSLKLKANTNPESGGPGNELARQLASLQTFIQQNVPTNLATLREDFGTARCTNPRDRVYAALSMLQPAQRSLFGTPDYGLSTAGVYADAVARHAQCYGTLNILAECDLVERGEGVGGPSWVPDWSVASRSGNGFLSTFVSSVLAAWFEMPGGGRLRVAGIPVGGVVERVEPTGFLDDHEGPDKAMSRILELLPRGREIFEPYPDGGTMLDASIRTLICDDFAASMVPPDDFLPDFAETREFFAHSYAAEADADAPSQEGQQAGVGAKYAARVSHIASAKKLFTTSNGRIGLGPHATQPGDLPFALLGCDFLMILRPADEPGQFRVVGPGFMCGLTEGEAFLGPLPGGVRRAFVYHERQELYVSGFVNDETGGTFFEDPRLSGFEFEDVAGYLERLKVDPEVRLETDPEVFRGKGVEVFDLV